jgi:hypothetical protein
MNEEAEMQDAPEPNVDRMISGGRVRQRRRTITRACVVGAVAVVIAGGVYGVTKDSGTSSGPAPATTPSPTPAMRTPTDMLVGDDASGTAINAHLTLYGSWEGDNFPVLRDASGRYGGVAVYRPLALAAGTGCLGDRANTHVGQKPQALAGQLARLPGSTVVVPPAPVEAFGHRAFHLQLQIDTAGCEGSDVYRVAETPNGGHGISYGDARVPVVVDFWVRDVHGVPVVVETWHKTGASSQMVSEIARTKDSITFVSER